LIEQELTVIKNEFEIIVSLFEKIKTLLPKDFVSVIEEKVKGTNPLIADLSVKLKELQNQDVTDEELASVIKDMEKVILEVNTVLAKFGMEIIGAVSPVRHPKDVSLSTTVGATKELDVIEILATVSDTMTSIISLSKGTTVESLEKALEFTKEYINILVTFVDEISITYLPKDTLFTSIKQALDAAKEKANNINISLLYEGSTSSTEGSTILIQKEFGEIFVEATSAVSDLGTILKESLDEGSLTTALKELSLSITILNGKIDEEPESTLKRLSLDGERLLEQASDVAEGSKGIVEKELVQKMKSFDSLNKALQGLNSEADEKCDNSIFGAENCVASSTKVDGEKDVDKAEESSSSWISSIISSIIG